jgi:hypothetical protein
MDIVLITEVMWFHCFCISYLKATKQHVKVFVLTLFNHRCYYQHDNVINEWYYSALSWSPSTSPLSSFSL